MGLTPLERIGICPHGSTRTLSLQTLRRSADDPPFRSW